MKINISFFTDKGYHKIGVCGMNAYAKKIIKALSGHENLEVVFIYDENSKIHIDYGTEQISSLQDLPYVDVIINSDIAYSIDMCNTIRSYYDGPIVDLEEYLRDNYQGSDFYELGKESE